MRSPAEGERLELFVALSETMLDVAGLSPTTARAFMRIVADAAPATYGTGALAPLDVVLLTFKRLRAESEVDLERRTAAVLYADMTLGPILKNVLIVWYNGGLGAVAAPAGMYAEALVWPAISAGPPGIPGPYYGSWGYPPEQPILAPDDA